jgi:hypothetical protein
MTDVYNILREVLTTDINAFSIHFMLLLQQKFSLPLYLDANNVSPPRPYQSRLANTKDATIDLRSFSMLLIQALNKRSHEKSTTATNSSLISGTRVKRHRVSHKSLSSLSCSLASSGRAKYQPIVFPNRGVASL